jgi:GeoRSP system SPASM domain protein
VLDLLDTPLRLSWDLPAPADCADGQELRQTAEAIAAGGVFLVSLLGRPLLHASLGLVLESLAGRSLQLVCAGSEGELRALERLRLPRAGVQLLLDVGAFLDSVGSCDRAAFTAAIEALRGQGCEPLPVLTPTRHNLNKIGELIAFCAEFGLAGFKLSNAHIDDSVDAAGAELLPCAADLESFRKAWQRDAAGLSPLPALEIHDLFLWQIMTPGEQQNRSEYEGCQAGNSLGHVDRNGVVHPCAAWPQPLGDLRHSSLADIWSDRGRHAVRAAIAQVPSGCAGCRDLAICHGGCRGLSRLFNRAAGERDLLCSGRR